MPTSVKSTKDSDAPTVRFTNTQDLFDIINSTTGDFLTVTNVSPNQFTEIERERDIGRRTGQKKRYRMFRLRRYNANFRILIITIPTDVHEVLHLELYDQYREQLAQNGRGRSWRSIGSATRRAEEGHPDGDGGEGDSTGGPKPERGNKGAWPTLVIESGHSESLGESHNDMKWWFSTSDHQVKIVLLAKFDDTRSIIILEKREEEAKTCLGATTTRRFAAIQPTLRQSITIAQNATTDPVSYNVTRGALKLSFRLLFLRNPGPEEADFLFTPPPG
ncbi:hypothetical protein B0T26DRAFT_630926 [Lasiosphaeria miniovina]|uniref:Uncharacterized protein n=1 Tax=Lasiosphaeria miniovina TaxID=1954250 RepID=A0AA40BH37_9PEZI|nr:uncharacterized protein B0T26DRAFT_630926 [Lasiosphaeria miniovina]KAK0734113.1 hypothetical protein B0T26DRAFT_630926 [Lasiosphaeria miniovina]